MKLMGGFTARGLAASAVALGRHILAGKPADVVFYSRQLFNRSSKGDNPFFAPLKELCEEMGLSYIALEEPDGNRKWPRDPKLMKADLLCALIIALRKWFVGIRKLHQHAADIKIARIIDIVTLRKLRAPVYVTIANSLIDVLAEINPDGVAYDYQHGVIHRGHEGYFDGLNHLRSAFDKPNRRILLWGEVYRNCFKGVYDDEEFARRIITLGYPISLPACAESPANRNVVLVSLQITYGKEAEEFIPKTFVALSRCLEALARTGRPVLLKHHPRYRGGVSFDSLLLKYPFVSFTERPLEELALSVWLQLTWTSTTGFEYANYGIPTYFMVDGDKWSDNIFYGQYDYPLYRGMAFADVLERLSSPQAYRDDCEAVKAWYQRAYSPFDKSLAKKILNPRKHT